MARELYRFAVTVPAGTAQATPATTSLRMPTRQIERIEIIVPAGPRGTVGFRLASGGVPMVPINAGGFIVTDNEKMVWDLVDQITSGAWECSAFNVGNFAHTIEFRFLAALLLDPGDLSGFVPLSAAALSSSTS